MVDLFYRILSLLTWPRTVHRGPRAVGRRLARREGYRIVRRLIR